MTHINYPPQRIKVHETQRTFPSAALNQTSYKEWLTQIMADFEAGIIPLILAFKKNHYNAILLTKETTATSRKPTKTRRSRNSGEHQQPRQRPRPARRSNAAGGDEGPTRQELINSQSSIAPTALLQALGQTNWSRREKKVAIDSIVLGPDRTKELLAFCCDDPGDSASDSGISCIRADGSPESSAYAPSASPPGTGASDTDSGSQASVYSLPPPRAQSRQHGRSSNGTGLQRIGLGNLGSSRRSSQIPQR